MPDDRGRRHAVAVGLGALLAALPVVLAGLAGAGHATRVVDLVDGAAWLVSPGHGLVSLVDGPTAQVAVTLRLPVADDRTRVVQGRDAAWVVRAGTVARLDAATWQVGRAVALSSADAPLTVLPGAPPTVPGAPPTVLPGASRDARGTTDATDAAASSPLWAVDGRTVRVLDARTLDVRATADVRLDGTPRAVVDARGDLWAADDDRVVRVRLTHGALVATPVGHAGGDLVLVQGRAVLVDVAGGTVRALDGRRAGTCPGTRSSGPVPVVGSTTSPEVFAAVDGSLRVAGTDGTCGTVARVGGRDADLAALAQVDRYVVAPDRATGVTTVVDRRSGAVQTFALTDPGHRVELVVRGRTVFWNDLDGHGSGLLRLADDAWRSTPVDKYDPTTGVGTQVARIARTGPAGAASAGTPAGFRVAALVADRRLHAPGDRALVTADVTGEPAPGEVWWWRFEDLATGAGEDLGTGTPGAPLEITALPGVGEYAVTLSVLRDGATASASVTLRVVEWCALTVAPAAVDLTAAPGTTVEVTVDPDCPVAQRTVVTSEPWLAVTASGDLSPGTPLVLTLRATGTPPAPGATAGALRVEVEGRAGSQVRVDVAAASS